MAKVPYQPFETEQPFNPRQPREQLDINAQPEVFGSVGHAIAGLGTTIDKVSEEMFQRAQALQEVKNEKDATDQTVLTNQKVAMEAKAFESLGDRMSDPANLQAHLERLNQIRIDGRNQLGNVDAQRMYDREAASLQNRFTVLAAERSGQALKDGVVKTAEAQLQNDRNNWADPKDPQELKTKQDHIPSQAETVANTLGYGGDRKQAWINDAAGKLRAAQLTRISQTDSTNAMEMLHDPAIQKELGAEYDHTYDIVLRQYISTASNSIAKAAFDPNKTEEQMERVVMDHTPKFLDGDEIQTFQKEALQVLRNRQGLANQATFKEEHMAEQTIYKALGETKPDGTPMYTSKAEMLTNPELAKAINTAPAEFANTIDAKLYTTIKAKDEAAHWTNYNTLVGLAQSDSQAFLRADLFDPSKPISNDQRGTLLKLRERILNGNFSNDPAVMKAVGVIRGIYSHSVPPVGTDEYHAFLGELYGMIQDLQATKGGKADDSDYERIGKAMIQTIPGTGWLSDYETWKAPVPPNFKTAHPDLNDDELSYWYHRTEGVKAFNKLFGTGGGGGGSQ